MSTPSHTDDIDYANASTSTAAASTTTISDGRTKHRAVGADDDDAPFVGAGAELSVVDDAQPRATVLQVVASANKHQV
jgi:hypothetical protein